jgi:hypothetical protein
MDRVFLKYFTRYYDKLYEDWIETSKLLAPEKRDEAKESLLDLSVQLFTVPSIALDLVKQENLLDILLKTFNNCLMQAWEPEKEYLDCDHNAISNSLFWRAYIDVKYVLTNKNVAQYVAYNSDLLSKVTTLFVQLFYSFSYCNP